MGNYAPNPNTQDIYNQLATIDLANITAEQIENLTKSVKLSASNQDALIVMNIINQAAMRDGKPMGGTMKCLQKSATESGTQYTIFQPAVGEVWQVSGSFSTSGSGISGTVFLEIKLRDLVNGITVELISTSTTSGTDVPMTEVTQNPIVFDENMALQVEATGTFTSMTFAVPIIRIR